MRRFIYILTALFLAAPIGAEAENGRRMAVVELSTIYMRQKPDYESALETQALFCASALMNAFAFSVISKFICLSCSYLNALIKSSIVLSASV